MVGLIKTMAEQTQLRNKNDILNMDTNTIDINPISIPFISIDEIRMMNTGSNNVSVAENGLIYVSEDEEGEDNEDEDDDDEEEDEDDDDEEEENEDDDDEDDEEDDPLIVSLNIEDDEEEIGVVEELFEENTNTNNIKTINIKDIDLSYDFSSEEKEVNENENDEKNNTISLNEDIIMELLNTDMNAVNETTKIVDVLLEEKEKAKEDYKKYSLNKLREIALEKKIPQVDVSKLKKNELLKLLEIE